MNTVSQTHIAEAIYQEAEQRFSAFHDPAHGWEHVRRVYKQAIYIAEQEGANIFIVEMAALLHDIGRLVPKKGRPHAELSVEEAEQMLRRFPLKDEDIKAILHAIEAHSYSKGAAPQTLEAHVVRDADRLDALGAIGIMRWAITSAIKYRSQALSYHPEDPFAEWHELDDHKYRLDHFYTKLLKLEETMGTETGRQLARGRSQFMRDYLQEFQNELSV